MNTRLLALGLALGLCAPALAQFSPGNPMAGLEKLKDFEAMRDSSCDQDWRNGNGDARPIAPGDTLVLADLKGPGMIAHIWYTIAHSRALLLAAADAADLLGRREEPQRGMPDGRLLRHRPRPGQAVRLPAHQGVLRRPRAELLLAHALPQVGPHHGHQREPSECDAFYYYIDWQKHKSLPKDTAYFHAMYRQEYPCVMGQQLPARRHRGPRPLRGHGAERPEHVGGLVRRGRRLLLH